MENWSGPSRALEEHLKLLKISAESKRYIDRVLGKSTSFMDFIATPHREYTLGFATTYAKFPADLDGSSTASVRSGGLEEEYWTQRNVETAARLIKVEYEMLDEAVTYYVSDPLTQLITEAADTMLSEPLFPTDMPSMSGFAVFEQPWLLPDLHPDTGVPVADIVLPVRAMGWTVRDVPR